MFPFRPVKPAGKLSARQLNRAMDSIEQSAKITADPPLEVIRSPDGVHLRDNSLRPMHVQITGGGSGHNRYSGIQIASDNDGTVGELELGLEFDETTFPLVALDLEQGITADTIVWAWPSPSGRNYEFLQSGSGVGSAKHCLVLTRATTDGGIDYYPCTFRIFDPSTNSFDDGPQGSDIADCWLVQDKDYELHTPSNPGPEGTGCYTGLRQSGTKALAIFGVGPTPHDLPVYVTTEAPFLTTDCIVRN